MQKLIFSITAVLLVCGCATAPQHRQIDNTDLPFIDDPEVIGTWVSIDFVDRIGNFDPHNKRFSGELYLKELKFLQNGKTAKSFWT